MTAADPHPGPAPTSAGGWEDHASRRSSRRWPLPLGRRRRRGRPSRAVAAPGRRRQGDLHRRHPQDLDSLNPFTGIVADGVRDLRAACTTAHRLRRTKDFSAQPAAGRELGRVRRRHTWTYHLREGVTWSDGAAADRATTSPTRSTASRNGKYEQTNYGNYVAKITSGGGPDDRTVVMKTNQPTARSCCTSPCRSSRSTSGRTSSGEEVQSYPNEPGPDGIVGSGPFTLVEHKKGQFIRFDANKNYWAGAPHIDELVFRVFQQPRRAHPGACATARSTSRTTSTPNPWEALKKVRGRQGVPGGLLRLRRDRLQHRRRARRRDADRRRPPGAQGRPQLRRALTHAIDTQDARRPGARRQRHPGDDGHPAALREPRTSSRRTAHVRHRRRERRARRRRLREGPRRRPPDAGNGRPLVFRLFARQESTTSQRSAQFVQGWLKHVGITVNVKIIAEDNLTEIIGQGTFDMFEWGWVVEPDPDYQLSTFTCAKRSYQEGGSTLANLSDSFYCNHAYDALYAKQADADRPGRARRDRQADAADALRRRRVRRHVLLRRPRRRTSDRFTGFVAQPPPDGALLFQYGTYSYRNIALAAASTERGRGRHPDRRSSAASSRSSARPACSGRVFLWRRRGDAMDTE